MFEQNVNKRRAFVFQFYTKKHIREMLFQFFVNKRIFDAFGGFRLNQAHDSFRQIVAQKINRRAGLRECFFEKLVVRVLRFVHNRYKVCLWLKFET